MEKINEIVDKYINEKKSIKDLPADVRKGILSWVEDYKVMRKSGNIKGAKQGKINIDKEIKKLGLDPKEVYGINEAKDEFAGWIAIYGGKKIEIKKTEAKDLWGAKQLAIEKLKVPKSKQGLLAIEPAYED